MIMENNNKSFKIIYNNNNMIWLTNSSQHLNKYIKIFLKPLNNNYDKFNNLSDKKIINLKRNYQTEL